MKLSLFIAKRYLFSPKKRNAINIISLISIIGVAIGTSALIVVLSVFNGIDSVLSKAGESFSTDLMLSPAQGKFIDEDTLLLRELLSYPEVRYCDPVIEETALAKFGDLLIPVTVKGISSDYDSHTNISASVFRGKFSLEEEEKATAIVGYGIAAALQLQTGLHQPITLYYPDRTASSASLSAINSQKVFPVAIFTAQQELDNKYIFVRVDVAQQLFDIPGKISRIEIRLHHPEALQSVKEQLQKKVGSTFNVEDKYDLNRSFYAMMRMEKLSIFLILLFILCIASFNIIGSISMLIIDKREDIGIYEALGMSPGKLRSIFTIEGNLITGVGAVIGLILGTTLCLLQEHFGFITLGNGNYIIDAYPVVLIGSDIVMIMLAVLSIGFLASYFPVRFLIRNMIKK